MNGAPDADVPSCHRYRIATDAHHRVRARCSCGWESGPTSAAGMAGALWDRHAGLVAPVVRRVAHDPAAAGLTSRLAG